MNLNKQIIAIQGVKGSGKDLTAKIIQYLLCTPSIFHNYRLAKLLNFANLNFWKIVHYADNLKLILSILLNEHKERFDSRLFKETYYYDFNNYELKQSLTKFNINFINDKTFNRELKKNNENVALKYNLSIRQILQYFGTDVMRKHFGDDIWIRSTLNNKNKKLIIADQRFINENKLLTESKNDTFIIHLIRDSCSQGNHKSESELMTLLNENKYDVLLKNNGSIKELFNKCKTIIKNYKNVSRNEILY